MTVLAIPANSTKADAAHQFIDFILDPRIAGELVTSASPGLGLNLPKEKIPLNFYGNPANIEASQLMDDFSVQSDITREPRQEVLDLFKSLPAPTAPPAP
jgi:spermidine/putrescine-binding protein